MVLNNAVKSSESRRKWNNTEQCVNQSEQEPKKGREIPKKLTQRAKELSKLINSRDEINVQPCKNSHIIHLVINKRNQTWFVHVFRNLTQRKKWLIRNPSKRLCLFQSSQLLLQVLPGRFIRKIYPGWSELLTCGKWLLLWCYKNHQVAPAR